MSISMKAAPAATEEQVPGLALVIGASLARPVEKLRALLRDARVAHAWSEARQAAMEDAVEEAHRISVQSQQLDRLASGHLRQSQETLQLHAVVLDLLVQRQAAFKRQGIVLRQHLRPVDVIVDPGLLLLLLDALIDWATPLGTSLWVRLEMRNWPLHGLLTLRAARADLDVASDADADGLAWQLATRTAHAMELELKRQATDGHIQASVEFPRTVARLSGLTALEADRELGPDDSRIKLQTSHLAGVQVLLVTDDRSLQRDVAAVCEPLGLKLEFATRGREAFERSELSRPELIILDETLHDDFLADYLQNLMRERPHFHAVEVTARDTGFAISSWEGTGMSRISRDGVRDQLKTVLAIEFGP